METRNPGQRPPPKLTESVPNLYLVPPFDPNPPCDIAPFRQENQFMTLHGRVPKLIVKLSTDLNFLLLEALVLLSAVAAKGTQLDLAFYSTLLRVCRKGAQDQR